MPIQIGASLHDFSNPTGMLFDCHRHIEMFLGSLQAVAKVIDRPCTAFQAQRRSRSEVPGTPPPFPQRRR